MHDQTRIKDQDTESPGQDTESLDSGFGLIEMAVIMVIVGVIIATIMPRIVGRMGTDRAKKAKYSLQETRDEIVGYAIRHDGVLPVPAGAGSGTPTVDKALIAHHEDLWGQPIGYIVAKADTGMLYSVGANNATTTELSEALYNYRSADGGSEQRSTDNVAFIIFSKGPNQQKDLEDTDAAIDGSGQVQHYPFGADLDSNTATAGDNDDLIEYVILDYLQTKTENSDDEETAAAGSDVSTTNTDGSGGDAASFNDAAVSNPAGTGTTVVINDDGTIDLGNGATNDEGCLWYQGDSSAGRCTDGKCEFNYGIRAFFRFKFNDTDNSSNSGDHRAGFTFSVIDGDINASTVCGRYGHTIGYACASDATANCIQPYKMAVEVDTFPNGGLAADGNDNHVAWLFWDDNDNSGTDRYNDVNHEYFGVGSCQAANNVGTHNPERLSPCAQNADAFHSEARVGGINWLEDEIVHTMRIEIYRNATHSAGDPNGSNVVNATAWIDCDTDCSDLTQPYAGTADARIFNNSTLADNATTGSGGMQYFRFGWTEGSGGGTNQSLTISDFGIKFLNTEPNHKY